MRRWGLVAISLACVAALGLLIYPLTVIQPFKHQNPQDLQRALAFFRIAPAGSLLIALLALAILVFAWRSMRVRARMLCAVLCTVACAAAFLTRVNVFEQMFHPAGTPQFVAVRSSTLDPKDMLTTVSLHGDAHAYPIREMGYHHVVNDFVGGVPIVATY